MYRNSRNAGNPFMLVLFMLLGIVAGGFAGQALASLTPMLSWLNFGYSFGITSPVSVDLGIIAFTFGITIKFTIGGIVGAILSIVIYRFM